MIKVISYAEARHWGFRWARYQGRQPINNLARNSRDLKSLALCWSDKEQWDMGESDSIIWKEFARLSRMMCMMQVLLLGICIWFSVFWCLWFLISQWTHELNVKMINLDSALNLERWWTPYLTSLDTWNHTVSYLKKFYLLSEISGSNGCEYEDGCLVGCCTVQSCRMWPTF